MSGRPRSSTIEIRLVALDRLERRATAHRGQHVIAARPQQRGHGADDVRFVVDDEDARGHCYCATVAARTGPGTTIVNRAPAPGTFSAQTRPPAAASSPRVIESPMPVPNDAWRAARPR